jgi:hypothetical protein
VQILDIFEKGKALIVVLHEGKLITAKGTPIKVTIGEGKTSKILNCQVTNRIKRCRELPVVKVLIENLHIHQWLNDKDRKIFFRMIPNLAVTTEFSFITNTTRKHEMLLRAEDTVLSPEVANTGDFEPPSDTEVEESEEEPMNSPLPVIQNDSSTEF